MTEERTSDSEIPARIIDLLRQYDPRALPILTIANRLGIDRKTASKYLELLAQSGDISMQRFGQKKLFRVARRRISLPAVLDRLHDAVMVLDDELIIRMVNASLLSTFEIHPSSTLVGVPLFDLNLPIFIEPSVRENIRLISAGQPFLPEMQLIEGRSDRIFLVEFDTIGSIDGRPDIMISLRDITALKKAETDLRASEKKIAALFESIPGGIIMFSSDGAILNANNASLRVLGLHTLADLRNASVFDLACYRDKLPSLIRAGRTTETELVCDFDKLRVERGIESTKSGVAYFEVVFTPIPSERGGVSREYAILFKDITAKKQAERELRDRLEGISSSLPGMTYQFYARDTGEWGVYHVDPRSEAIFGLRVEPLKDWFQRFSACIAPEDRNRWEESIRDVIRRVAPWDFEGRFIKPSGEEMYLRGSSQPIRMKHETVWNGIFFDVTDRKKTEEALKVSHFLETRYRSFFEDTCNGVLIYQPIEGGADYLIRDVNRVTAELLRMNRADLIGRRLFEVFPELPDPDIRDMLYRVLTTEEPEVVPPLRYRDRDDFPWISHYVFKLPSGELASFMIDVSDVLEHTSDRDILSDRSSSPTCRRPDSWLES
ncbi:MAG TPA: PAS domain S-box protein [Methanoregulaceae archaeon]|nr:PAS domain S-box protein [Methanoregulaceae archaeon]HQJ87615.1 PAS domain S-box protein [Methanoregulaceae archaeon]